MGNNKKKANEKEQALNKGKEMMHGHKVMGIIAGIILIIMALGMFAAPLLSTAIIVWIFIAGVMIYGIFMVMNYMKATDKNGWNLASGIMSIVLGVLLIFSPALAKGETFAFILAFILLSTGMNQIVFASQQKKAGMQKTGWTTFSGVLNLLISIVIMVRPIAMMFAYEMILAVYLLFIGITVIAASFAVNSRSKR